MIDWPEKTHGSIADWGFETRNTKFETRHRSQRDAGVNQEMAV
jgi:hypothetical protein